MIAHVCYLIGSKILSRYGVTALLVRFQIFAEASCWTSHGIALNKSAWLSILLRASPVPKISGGFHRYKPILGSTLLLSYPMQIDTF